MNTASRSLIRAQVSGPRACFRRPEFKDDFVSYDVMPPTVMRRLLDALNPIGGMQWHVSRLHVLSPISTRWEEIDTSRGARRALVLTDVAYVVEGALRDTSGLSASPTPPTRQASLGDRPIHLGLSDFPARVTLLAEDDRPQSALSDTGSIDLGWMVYDTVSGKRDRFFRARMIDGIIDLSRPADLELAS